MKFITTNIVLFLMSVVHLDAVDLLKDSCEQTDHNGEEQHIIPEPKVQDLKHKLAETSRRELEMSVQQGELEQQLQQMTEEIQFLRSRKLCTVFARDSVYAMARICYRNSVCLSVTRVDQSKTVEVRTLQFSPCSSPIPLVFAG